MYNNWDSTAQDRQISKNVYTCSITYFVCVKCVPSGFCIANSCSSSIDWHHFFSSFLLGLQYFKIFVCCTREIHNDSWGENMLKTWDGHKLYKTSNHPWCRLAKYFTYHDFKFNASMVRESICNKQYLDKFYSD